jgi:hypothetical protein
MSNEIIVAKNISFMSSIIQITSFCFILD